MTTTQTTTATATLVRVATGEAVTLPLEDKGYCRALSYGASLRVMGRKCSPGFCENGREVMGGPIVPVLGWVNLDAVVISAHAIYEDVTEAAIGDLLIESGRVWRIVRKVVGGRNVPLNCSDAFTLELLA